MLSQLWLSNSGKKNPGKTFEKITPKAKTNKIIF